MCALVVETLTLSCCSFTQALEADLFFENFKGKNVKNSRTDSFNTFNTHSESFILTSHTDIFQISIQVTTTTINSVFRVHFPKIFKTRPDAFFRDSSEERFYLRSIAAWCNDINIITMYKLCSPHKMHIIRRYNYRKKLIFFLRSSH